MEKKQNKIKELITVTNTSFFSFEDSQRILIEKSEPKDLDEVKKVAFINDALKKISENKSIISLDGIEYKLIEFGDYSKYKRTSKEREKKNDVLVIENKNGQYNISTGLYCGSIRINEDLSIIITCGLSDLFFKRILNFCCGIYADINKETNSSNSSGIYSLIVQYMYLMSLRKVIHKTFPKKYVEIKERGYSINGNIDIDEYINNDILSFDKKISYTYSERLEIQSIIDVLFYAFKECKISSKNDVLPDSSNFGSYLKENYSGIKPNKKIINNILKEKCLYNSLYSEFKKPLEYARIVLNTNELNIGSNNKSTLGNFLVDSSFLWEMYLYNLMLLHLDEWEIDSQSNLSFYNQTFYKKTNYPDFVLKNKYNGKIAILDAKFKRMTYSTEDVDNEDLRQLHSYSYYYSIKYGDNFIGAGLIYPSHTFRESDVRNVDNMFGLDNAKAKFGVFTIKDPNDNEKIVDNELLFIDELKKFLE